MDEADSGDETQLLGGNIELVGFRELDGGSMIILKKIIGNYARKFSDRFNGIDKLTLEIGKADQGAFALICKLSAGGRDIRTELVHGNVFMLVDNALKKIESEL